MGETNTAVEMSTLPLGKMEIEKEVDGAASYLAHSTSYPPMTLEVERKLLRKIDCILVPMLLLTATLGAVDKVALSTAAIYGLEKDLHLVGQQYSWAGSILSIGEGHHWDVPFFLPRTATPIRKISFFVLPRLVLLSSADTRIEKLERADGAEVFYGDIPNLGYLEAIIVPTISLIVAGFYKKAEQPPRNAIVFAAFSSVINGFLSWAVGHIPDSAPLAIWQYLYLIVGK
ncbi:MFS transporter [Aspergillus niger]|nr:MFS transporter [Aspergillus niger]